MEAGDAHVGQAAGAHAVGGEHRRALVGHGQVGGAGGEQGHGGVGPGRGRPPDDRRPAAAAAGGDARRAASAWAGLARVSTTGPSPPLSSSTTIAAHCSGVLPGP